MLLVHVAGTADLGIPLIVGGRSRPRQETAELTARRAAELDDARTGGRAADLLLGLRFTQKDPRADDAAGPAPGSAPPAAAPAPSGGAPPAAAPGSALRKELGALARLAGEPGTSSEDIDILIVGVEGGSTPTDSIARALVGALRRASAQVRDLVAGRRARVLDACILPGLQASRASIETLERAIGGHDGHVLLALAGGATTVFAEVAGVAAATHGDEWSLALIDRVGDDRAGGAAPILRMSVDGEDPLRGWLMGLGLPTVLAREYDGRGTGAQAGGEMPDEVRRAAGALRRAVGETPVEGGIGPEDFAQLLWTDTARGDLAAGMALRAWVAAEYRRRRRQYLDRTGLDEAEHPDALRRKGGELGRAIGRLEKEASTRPLAAPEAWLVAQRDFIDLGIGATHRFDEAGDDLRERVRAALGGPPPDWLSWPSGTVCLLTAQGQPRGRGRGPERDPIAVALLRAQPDPALRRACSVPGPLTLRTFIACSDDSLGEGRGVVDRLAAGDVDHHADWEPPGADGATARSYGRAATSDGVTASGAEESMSRAGRLAAQWLEDQLEERWSRPRAIVVTVLGGEARRHRAPARRAGLRRSPRHCGAPRIDGAERRRPERPPVPPVRARPRRPQGAAAGDRLLPGPSGPAHGGAPARPGGPRHGGVGRRGPGARGRARAGGSDRGHRRMRGSDSGGHGRRQPHDRSRPARRPSAPGHHYRRAAESRARIEADRRIPGAPYSRPRGRPVRPAELRLHVR